jgi:phosphoribosyl 1,2-cyclic phosphodiesterase
VGVFTDIGTACDQLKRYFTQCHAAFLEANYDEEMLRNGNYPYHLKKRISGGKGHLSNREALEFFRSNKPVHMSYLVLAHLSKNNNCPDLVKNLFTLHKEGTEIVVASRFEETPVMTINPYIHSGIKARPVLSANRPMQISMF